MSKETGSDLADGIEVGPAVWILLAELADVAKGAEDALAGDGQSDGRLEGAQHLRLNIENRSKRQRGKPIETNLRNRR